MVKLTEYFTGCVEAVEKYSYMREEYNELRSNTPELEMDKWRDSEEVKDLIKRFKKANSRTKTLDI